MKTHARLLGGALATVSLWLMPRDLLWLAISLRSIPNPAAAMSIGKIEVPSP